tara:strand:+ start:241 stop:528 length:288 start_codon:yes stop_codon:yes gene_type:complete
MNEIRIINNDVEGIVTIGSIITYRIVLHEKQGDTYVKIVDEERTGEVVEIRNGFFRIVTDVEYLPHVEHVDFNFVLAIEPPKQDIMSLLDWRKKS